MTNPRLLTIPFADTGTKNEIPVSGATEPQLATFQAGFPVVTQQKIADGGIPPERADFNGILNIYGQHVVHLNKGMAYEFDQDFANAIGGYPLHARIMLSDGQIAQNTIAGNVNNPNTSSFGWLIGISASLIKDESGITQQGVTNGLPSISALLSLSNKINGNRQYVAAGRQQGWFIYNQSRASENDGGTIINGWERVDFNHITLDMFDCDSTGLTAIDAKLLKVFAASKQLKKPIRQNHGTYVLSGSTNFAISQDTDFKGAVFKLASGFTARFTIDRGTQKATYDSTSALVTQLKALGEKPAGTTRFDISDVTSLIDCYIEVRTSQPFFNYRGATINRIELNKVFKNNELAAALYYALDFSLVTTVVAQKKHQDVLVVQGLCFDETLNDSSVYIVDFRDSNNFKLIDTSFIDNSTTARSTNQIRVGFINCHDYETDLIQATSALQNAASTYNYTLYADKCFQPHFKAVSADGIGWGQVGTVLCSRVEYTNCQVNRIDMHQPTFGYVKINNSTIGAWGVIASVCGDLILNDCELITRPNQSNGGFIRTREECGFIDGDIIINNLTLSGENASETRRFINSVGNEALPAGTPITNRLGKTLKINGITNNVTGTPIYALIGQAYGLRQTVMPKMINLSGVSQALAHNLATIYVNEMASQTFQTVFSVRDSQFDGIQIRNIESSVKNQNVKLIIDNIQPVTNNGVFVRHLSNGAVIAENTPIRQYSEGWAEGGAASFSPPVFFSKTNFTGESQPPVNSVTNFANRISVSQSNFTYSLLSDISPYLRFGFDRLTRFNNERGLVLWTGSANSTGTVSVQLPQNPVVMRVEYTLSGEQRFDEFVVNRASSTKTIATSNISIVIGSANFAITGVTGVLVTSARLVCSA